MRVATCCCILLTGFGLASCASDRAAEKARYEERQQIRHQGQAEANRAADSGRSDLDRATAPK